MLFLKFDFKSKTLNNMKKIALIVLMSLAYISSQAQGRFSGGLELGLPVGDFSDLYSLEIGASLRYEYPMADKISIMGTAGYQSFLSKIEGVDASTVIPIQVGAKYYFSEAWNGFYGSAELGLNIFTGGDESESKFGYAPGIGYCVTENIDLGIRYQMIPFDGGISLDYHGRRAAYVL